MAKYSVVFHPSAAVIETVREFKEQLNAKIGWYPSKNSLAHVTICEFDCDTTTYETIKNRITAYCQYQKSFAVIFNSFGNYSNGAFFIAPDAESKAKMVTIMKEIPKEIQFSVNHKSSEPHISIGRQLSSEQLQIAYSLFQKVHLEFLCNGITIRKFNPERKQYDLVETIPFTGSDATIIEKWILF